MKNDLEPNAADEPTFDDALELFARIPQPLRGDYYLSTKALKILLNSLKYTGEAVDYVGFVAGTKHKMFGQDTYEMPQQDEACWFITSPLTSALYRDGHITEEDLANNRIHTPYARKA